MVKALNRNSEHAIFCKNVRQRVKNAFEFFRLSKSYLKTAAVSTVEIMTPGRASARICQMSRLKMCHSRDRHCCRNDTEGVQVRDDDRL